MVEDLFAIYSMVEPPKIYKDNPNLVVQEINEGSITSYPAEINNDMTTSFWQDYPEIVGPSNHSETHSGDEQKSQSSSPTVLKGSPDFEKVLDEAQKINPEVEKYKEFLIKTAKRESGFNSHIQNKAGAPYYGYFQMGKEEIKRTTGLSVEEFRNNPVQQVLGAVKLYKMNLKIIKALGIYSLGKDKGYSDDALVAGAWMGGPGGVKKYLLGQGDPSDSHWYKNGKGGSSVGKIMNNWKENELDNRK